MNKKNVYFIIGDNSAGKTLFLQNKYIEYAKTVSTKNIITNLPEYTVSGTGIDSTRLALLQEIEDYQWGYGTLEVANQRIVLLDSDELYTQAFTDMLTLLCTQGSVLILDEPEFGLRLTEQELLNAVLKKLLPTFKDIYVATHCTALFSVSEDDYYWLDNNGTMARIERAKLYGYVN